MRIQLFTFIFTLLCPDIEFSARQWPGPRLPLHFSYHALCDFQHSHHTSLAVPPTGRSHSSVKALPCSPPAGHSLSSVSRDSPLPIAQCSDQTLLLRGHPGHHPYYTKIFFFFNDKWPLFIFILKCSNILNTNFFFRFYC